MEVLSEKYRPKELKDLVFTNKNQGEKIKNIIKDGKFNTHMIFSGSPGLGKTSTINVLLNELHITDYKKINGSDKTSIDDTKPLIDYASIPPISGQKVIIFEEFERMSKQAQDSLKMPMDQYSSWCIFLFTTNNIQKISDAIISRSEVLEYETLSMDGFVSRIVKILDTEFIEYSVDDIIKYVKMTYPDLRKCINVISNNVIKEEVIKNKLDNDGESSIEETKIISKLKPLEDETILKADTFDDIIGMFVKNGAYSIKQKIINDFSEQDYEAFYNYIWKNPDKITEDKSKWSLIISSISPYYISNSSVLFKYIPLFSYLYDIERIINE